MPDLTSRHLIADADGWIGFEGLHGQTAGALPALESAL